MKVEYKTEKGIIQFRMIPNDGNVFNTGITSKNPTDEGFDFIGLSTEITEEQAKMMVDEVILGRYENYLDKSSLTSKFGNALSGFKSLMQHLKVYEVNPLGEKATILNLSEHIEAEKSVGKWVVLFKPNV